jgi:CHAD domain-containing protein
MAYRLKVKESVPEGIRRIVVEEVEAAEKELGGHGSTRETAIHESRKSIKKIRGALRLMRPELGDVYRNENARFRNIGRRLSEVRDAAAVIEVFDSIVEKFTDNLRQNSLGSVRRALQKMKRETEERVNLDKLTQQTVSALSAAKKRLKKWPLQADGFQAIAPGLELTYRKGRKALARVKRDPVPENRHYFRRRVKDHWYQVRLLENVWTDVMLAHEASLKNIETWLGDDHNLVVLCERMHKEPEKFGDDKAIQLFISLAERRQKELRENAISLGERVYAQKPRQFLQYMSKLWDDWQNEPGSAKQIKKEQRPAVKKPPAQQLSRNPRKNTTAVA